MNIKPIKTESEYKQAMAEIDQLLDIPEGDPREEYLGLVSILVEAYEQEYFPLETRRF